MAKLARFVPCAIVRSIDEVYNDKELRKLGVLRDVTNTFDGYNSKIVHVVAPPTSFKSKEAKWRTGTLSVPMVGEDTEKILKSLRYTSKDIKRFRQTGAV